MDEGKKHLREEVAALSGTIRELREELTALRSASTGHHCHCGHMWVYPNYPAVPAISYPVITQPYVVTCGTTTTTTTPAISTSTIAGGSYGVALS